jgi:Winged helix DNA-binding domain
VRARYVVIMSTGDLLEQRSLNRALLERQLLLRRHRMTATQALEHLVGLQAQAPRPPYVGLWTRLEGFAPDDLARLLSERDAVRVTLMRGTIHLVSANDGLTIRPLLQPALERGVYTNSTFGRHRLDGVDVAALLAAGRELVEERPRTVAELRDLLGARWPEHDPAAMAQAVRGLVPMVHVPPRGLWGRSGPVALTTLESWLGRGVDDDGSPDTLVLRYLAAFGPASPADAQTWSGLTRLGEVFERLRPRLRAFRDERGRELFDLPDAPRPAPDAPAPVRLLPEFDNLTLSHADRTRVIADEHRRRIAARNGMVPGMVLVDGFVRGTWTLTRRRRSATLTVEPFGRLPRRDRGEVAQEAAALVGFAADDAETTDVAFA